MTLSIMDLIVKLSINDTQHKTLSISVECHSAECHIFIVIVNVIMLSVFMLNVVAPQAALGVLTLASVADLSVDVELFEFRNFFKFFRLLRFHSSETAPKTSTRFLAPRHSAW